MNWLKVVAGAAMFLFGSALDWDAVERLIQSVQTES